MPSQFKIPAVPSRPTNVPAVQSANGAQSDAMDVDASASGSGVGTGSPSGRQLKDWDEDMNDAEEDEKEDEETDGDSKKTQKKKGKSWATGRSKKPVKGGKGKGKAEYSNDDEGEDDLADRHPQAEWKHQKNRGRVESGDAAKDQAKRVQEAFTVLHEHAALALRTVTDRLQAVEEIMPLDVLEEFGSPADESTKPPNRVGLLRQILDRTANLHELAPPFEGYELTRTGTASSSASTMAPAKSNAIRGSSFSRQASASAPTSTRPQPLDKTATTSLPAPPPTTSSTPSDSLNDGSTSSGTHARSVKDNQSPSIIPSAPSALMDLDDPSLLRTTRDAQADFYLDLMSSDSCAWTVDWLLRCVCKPFQPPMIHPAIRESGTQDPPSAEGDFVLYVRMEERAVEEVKAIYESLSIRRPILTMRIAAARVALDKIPAGQKVVETYFGCSIRVDEELRMEEDMSATTTGKVMKATPWKRRVAEAERLSKLAREGSDQDGKSTSSAEPEDFDDFIDVEDAEIIEEKELEDVGVQGSASPAPPSVGMNPIDPSSSEAKTPATIMISPSSWRAFEFVELRTRPAVTQIDGEDLDATEVYLANPYLWLGEYILCLAGKGTAWNSAIGGAANLMQRIHDADVIEVVNSIAALKPESTATNDPSPALHQDVAKRVDLHYRRMYAYFASHQQRSGRSQGMVSPGALEKAIEMAANLKPLGQGVVSVILAKDVTVRDAQGRSTWWNASAGPGPKLYKYVTDVAISGSETWPNPFSTQGIAERIRISHFYGPFTDFWSIILLHLLVWLSCLFMGRYLELIKPKIIVVQSDKITALLKRGLFRLDDRSAIKAFVGMAADDDDEDILERVQSASAAGAMDPSSGGSMTTTSKTPITLDLGTLKKGRTAVEDDIKFKIPIKDEVKPRIPLDEEEHDPDGIKPPVRGRTPSPPPPTTPPTGKPPTTPPSSPDKPDDSPSPTSPTPTKPPIILIWEETPEGDWIIRIGVILVVCVGCGRWAVAVPTLDPGYYKYHPALQRSLLALYLLSASLARLAMIMAQNDGPELLTEATAHALQDRILQESERLGLDRQLSIARERVQRECRALQQLAQLAPADSMEAAMDRFNEQSWKARQVRARYFGNAIMAEGKPNSAARRAQVVKLMADPNFDLGTEDLPRGSMLLRLFLEGREEGKSYVYAVGQTKAVAGKPQGHTEQLARGRLIKAAGTGKTSMMPSTAATSPDTEASASSSGASTSLTIIGSTNAELPTGSAGAIPMYDYEGHQIPMNPATWGPFATFSGCDITEEEIFTRLTESHHIRPARHTAAAKEELRLWRCVDCRRSAITNKQNANHCCEAHGWSMQRVTSSASNLVMERLLWPFQLTLDPVWWPTLRSWMNTFNEDAFTTIMAGSGPDASTVAIVKTGPIPLLDECYLDRQRQCIVQSGYSASGLNPLRQDVMDELTHAYVAMVEEVEALRAS